jgi:hypothetical protein
VFFFIHIFKPKFCMHFLCVPCVVIHASPISRLIQYLLIFLKWNLILINCDIAKGHRLLEIKPNSHILISLEWTPHSINYFLTSVMVIFIYSGYLLCASMTWKTVELKFDSRRGQTALRPTQLATSGNRELLSQECDRGAEVKNAWSHTSTPQYIFHWN